MRIRTRLLLAFLAVLTVAALGVAVLSQLLTSAHVRGAARGGSDVAASHFLGILNRSLLIAVLVAAFFAVAVSVFLARRLARPLSELARATEAIARGDYRQRVRPGSNDELGELAISFNRMAASLDDLERLRRDLVANVAHELRTPLASLQAQLEAVADGVVTLDDELVESLREDTARLRRLVDDLRTLADAEAPATAPRLAQQDPRALVERAVATVASAYRAKGIALELAAEDDLAPVRVDRDQIEQVLVNLLDNALRYTPQGGEVDVRVQENDGAIEVAVADTGIGIAPDDLPRVFERFFRAERSRSRNTGGSGIGLAIAKHLVEKHRGTIEAKSAPGAGSVFTVRLPRAL